MFFGGAVQIYTFSNVGYLGSFIPVLIGYYLLRRFRPEMNRPVRLPGIFSWIALAMAALYFVIWSYGGLRRNARIGRHPDLLLHRVGRRAVVPAVLLVPGLCRGPEARRRVGRGDLPATAAGD